MNKSIVFAVVIGITIMFAACSAPANNADTAETTGQSVAEETKTQADSSLTLDIIKKAAQEAGYTVEAVQDFQLINGLQPVDGFNLIYKDENNESYIPVLEFKNADDAEAYAKQVNEAGYNLCIMNGKYLTLTSAQYGVTINDKQKSVLEKLLDSKVMEYTATSPAKLNDPKDYAGAYLKIDAICKALDELINKSMLLHDKSVPDGERISDKVFVASPISSMDLAFTSSLCENQTQLDAVVQVWEMFGCTGVKLEHASAHNYVLTGKRSGRETAFEIKCSFDPGTGSLRLTDNDGGEAFELYEFVPLGGDKYAFQTLYARSIVEYKDGKVMSFVYSLNKTDKALAYNSDSDGIYGKGAAIDEAWVSKNSEDSFEQFISYNGTKLKIAADVFTGERVKAEIDAQ